MGIQLKWSFNWSAQRNSTKFRLWLIWAWVKINQPTFGKGTSICQPFSWWFWCSPGYVHESILVPSILTASSLQILIIPEHTSIDFLSQTGQRRLEKRRKKSWTLGQSVRSKGLRLQSWDFRFRIFEASPIGSMYAIYGNIYHQYTPNVSIYIYIYIYHTWILWVIEYVWICDANTPDPQ